MLDKGLGPVGELERHDRSDGGSNHCPNNILGHKENQDAHDHHMMVVPDIDVHSIRLLENQKQNVDAEDLENQESNDWGRPRHRRNCTPANVGNVEVETKVGDHGCRRRANSGLKQVHQQVNANKAASNSNAALESLRNGEAENQTDHHDDEGKHYIRTCTNKCLEYCICAIEECVHSAPSK